MTSNADAATEQVLLTGLSNGEAIRHCRRRRGERDVADASAPANFGAFLPATARTYETASAATVTTTAG